MRLLITKLVKGEFQVPSGSGAEVGPGRFEQPVFERRDGIVIDRVSGNDWLATSLARGS
jgi:hypothetical protein